MAPTPPSNDKTLTGGITRGLDNIGTWLSDHWVWIALIVVAIIILFIVLGMRRVDAKRKLQRDAIERLRKNVILACKTNRAKGIKKVWTTGSPTQPPLCLGRYRGHTPHLDATWIAYKPGLFSRLEVCWVMPADITSAYDGRELSLRGLGVWHARDFAYLIPDAHDERERREWAKVLRIASLTPEDFVEAVKRFYARALDNAVAFHDAINAIEDRAYLRQEVTRGENERTETLSVPAQPNDPTPETGTPRSS